MSHTLNVGKFTIYHNGDFSGDVTFWTEDMKEGFDIPMEVLRAIIAEEIRRRAISFYESASTDEILQSINSQSS